MYTKSYKQTVSASLLYMFATTLVVTVLAPYLSNLGFSDSMVSWFFGIFSIIGALISIFIGDIGQAIGRTWIFRTAIIIEIIAFVLYLQGSTVAIFLARVLSAASFCAITTLLTSKVNDSVSSEKRGSHSGLYFSLNYLMRALSPFVAGVLADIYIGYPFFLAIGLLGSLVFILRNVPIKRKQQSIKIDPITSFRWFINNKDLRIMILLGPLTNISQALYTVFIPLIITNTMGLSYTSVGIATGIAGTAMALQYFVGSAIDRYGKRKFIIMGTMVFALCNIVLGFWLPDFTTLVILMSILSLALATWNVSAWVYMGDAAAKENMQSRMVGTYNTIGHSGAAIGYLLAGLIASLLGTSAVFIILGSVTAVSSLVAAVYLWHNHKHYKTHS